MTRFLTSIILSGAALLAAAPAHAAPADCEVLAEAASARHGLPEGLLRAIARTESGRTVKGQGYIAWPWTLNVAGEGMYFDTRDEALTYIQGLVDQGATNFDIGCMQINYRWHRDQFDTLEQMLDPAHNTDYGARYLAGLKSEAGSWTGATARYHSRTPERGDAYQAKVEDIRADLTPLSKDSPEVVQVVAAASVVDERFSSRPALISVPAHAFYWAKIDLPQGQLPRSVHEVLAQRRKGAATRPEG